MEVKLISILSLFPQKKKKKKKKKGDCSFLQVIAILNLSAILVQFWGGKTTAYEYWDIVWVMGWKLAIEWKTINYEDKKSQLHF